MSTNAPYQEVLAADRQRAAAIDDPHALLSIILDPEQRGELYPYFHRLRELAPVHKTEELQLHQAFVLTCHSDVDRLLRNHDMISDKRNLEVFRAPGGEKFYEMMRRLLLFLAPDDHSRVRSLIAKAFTPRAVEERRPGIERVVNDLLAKAEANGKMDLVEDYAYPIPIHVILEMIGIPQEDLPLFETWARNFSRRGDISALSEEVVEAGEDASQGFDDYFLDLVKQCRKNPRDDLMSALVHVEDEGKRLSDEEIVGSCVILLQAGHGTTADLIGLGTLAMFRHRDQMELLRRKPELIKNAVEEMIRFDTSVQISQRVGSGTTQVRDTEVPPDQVCVVLNGAANRDPARYDEPDRLDFERKDTQHLGFGLGNYVCLGFSLARAEAQQALLSLVQRFPDLRPIQEEADFRSTLFPRGLTSLEVTW